MKGQIKIALGLVCAVAMLAGVQAQAAATKKPNILVIWGDDIGYWNLSHINRGMMGYQTPNIDRIADEGLSFTDYYAELKLHRRSCSVHYRPDPCAYR